MDSVAHESGWQNETRTGFRLHTARLAESAAERSTSADIQKRKTETSIHFMSYYIQYYTCWKITKPILRTRKKISNPHRLILKYIINNKDNIQTKPLYLLWNPGINNVMYSSAQRRSTPRKENSSTTKPS